MAKHLELSINDGESLYQVAKALASHQRIDIMKILYFNSLSISEIAEQLQLPASSVAMHIRVLEQAGLIKTKSLPGTRGVMKLCSRQKDSIALSLYVMEGNMAEVKSYSMPVGNFTDCEIYPTCGIAGEEVVIVNEDTPSNFYTPGRERAKLIWTSGGFLEYRFPNPTNSNGMPVRKISLCAEICSEAPNYREDWPSDITLWVNGVDCGTWQSPGDFGSRQGRLNPAWWGAGRTQYGLLTTWSVDQTGTHINFIKVGKGTDIRQLRLEEKPYITVRLGNKPDAENIGGMNIFGNGFGDYEQDIVLTLEY